MSFLRILASVVLSLSLTLGFLPSPAAAQDDRSARPPGLDDAGWSSLRKAVQESVHLSLDLTGEGSVTGAEGAADDEFGSSLAVHGDTALVAKPYDSIGGNIEQGSAYIFTRSGDEWIQQAKLVASDGAAYDVFGTSVALYGDTALVGALLADIGDNSDQGAVYVFVRSGGAWTQQAKLIATDGTAGYRFGRSVALSGDAALVGSDRESAYVFTRSNGLWIEQAKLIAEDGGASGRFGSSVALSDDTALVGASSATVGANPIQGAVYVFTRENGTWTQQTKLVADDGGARDVFGYSVALCGDTALVGALRSAIISSNPGAAYVFTRNGNVWTQQAKLIADESTASREFGISVALSGDSALVGARSATIGGNIGQGTAYAFTRSDAVWTQQGKLVAEDGEPGNGLGVSVSLFGDTALAGAVGARIGANLAQGAAYAFTRSGSTWGQQAKLDTGTGSGGDQFGFSADISGDVAVVGARFDNLGSNVDQGSAYVFQRSGSSWILEAKLLAGDGAARDRFGESVAVSGDTVLVGAHLHRVGSMDEQGAAYVFTRSGGRWTQQTKLVADDGSVFDWFGFAVAISGDTALVGARYDDVGTNFNQGSAYVFTRSGEVWTQQAKLIADDGGAFDSFGFSVALSGNTALIGSAGSIIGANLAQGSAYVFTRDGNVWTQQAKLVADDGAHQDLFGVSVALDGDTALIGARLNPHPNNPTREQGAAYVFTRTGNFWTQQAKLIADDRAPGDRFGNSVALSGDIALVGSVRSDIGDNIDQGAAYMFRRTGSDWTQQAKLVAESGTAGDGFGAAVGLSGRTAIIGASGVDGPSPYGNPDEGAAYVGVPGGLFSDGFETPAESIGTWAPDF